MCVFVSHYASKVGHIFISKKRKLVISKINGRPSSPEPTTTTLALGDCDNFNVASIPLSCNILSVSDALKIRFASALPWASIRCRSASFCARSNLNSYSNDACSSFNLRSMASLIVGGKVTSRTKISSNSIYCSLTIFLVSSKISFWMASLLLE